MSENALATVNKAAMDLPEAWDRESDVVMAFAQGLEARWRIANMLAKSKMTREDRPEAIMAIMLKAFEMGVPLMQALSGMYFVDGKIALEGHLMDALAIQRCRVRKTIVSATRNECRMVLHRDGWEDQPCEYTLEDAKRAGLIQDYDQAKGTIEPARSRNGKPLLTWVKHTEEMLYWRALSKGLKRIAPDYFGGVYTLDELESVAEAHVVAHSNESTNAELRVLMGTDPVEPDPEMMSEDDIEQMRQELNRAEQQGLIDADFKADALEAAVRGEWAKARQAWEYARIEMARAEVGAAQGSFV